MTASSRSLVAMVLMSVGLIALVISGVSAGWNLLDGIGVVCLGLAIGAQYMVLRRARSQS
jgi:membrane-bound ClpP family serine protease